MNKEGGVDEYFSGDALFYIARDAYLGMNGRTFSTSTGENLLRRALAMPNLSPRLREEAEWFLTRDMIDRTSRAKCVRQLVLKAGRSERFFKPEVCHAIQVAANDGYPLAQSIIGYSWEFTNYIRAHEMAEKALKANELLAMTNECAARHGLCHAAQQRVVSHFDIDNMELYFKCFEITGEKFGSSHPWRVITDHAKSVTDCIKAYHMGRLLVEYKNKSYASQCIHLVDYFIGCISDCTRAISVWLLYSRFRLRLPRDMRTLVAERIWATRVGFNEVALLK